MGTVEEWTSANVGPMDYPFHLQVWPMQLLETAGKSRQSLSGSTW